MTTDDRFNPFGGLFDLLFEGAYVVDRERAIVHWNKAAEQITGYARDEVVGRHCFDNILVHVDCGGASLCKGGCPLHQSIADGQTRESELFLRHKEGHRVPVQVRVHPLVDAGGIRYGAVEVFRDTSTRVAALDRIRELEGMAYVDALTGLANRRFIDAQLQRKIDEMKRYGWPFGILFMDLDRFKSVNDTHGHAVGDKVLKVVAETLIRSSRSFDVVGRWGGEEFLAVVSNVSAEMLDNIAQRLRVLIARSGVFVQMEEIRVTISIGATMALPDDTPESLVARADALLYTSKESGRNTVTVG